MHLPVHRLSPEPPCSIGETMLLLPSLGGGGTIFQVIGAERRVERAVARRGAGRGHRIVAQDVEFVVFHAQSSPAERSNCFSRFFASWTCQETVASAEPITSAASAWLRPSP